MHSLPLEEKNFKTFIDNISPLKLAILYPIFIISRVPVWFVILFMYLRYNSISFTSLVLILSVIFVSRSYLEHLITEKKVSYFLISRVLRFIIEVAILTVVIYAYGNFIFNIEKIKAMDILFLFASLTIPVLLKWNVGQNPWFGYHLKALPLLVITYLWILISLSTIPFYIKIFAFFLIQMTELYNLIYEDHIGNKVIDFDKAKGINRLVPNIFRSKKNRIVKDENNLFKTTSFETINKVLFNKNNTKNNNSTNYNKISRVYNITSNMSTKNTSNSSTNISLLSVPNQFISFNIASESIDADLVRSICTNINNYRKHKIDNTNKATDIILNQAMLSSSFCSSSSLTGNVQMNEVNKEITNTQNNLIVNTEESIFEKPSDKDNSNSILNEYSIFNVDYNLSEKDNKLENKDNSETNSQDVQKDKSE